jgi:hypothetical protein
MKVYIGPYLNYLGPYQMVDLLQHVGVSEDRCWEIAKWIDTKFPAISKVCSWIYDKRKRTEFIHIDDYDVWSMDNTLANIILPLLKLLKEKKQSSAMVDDEDVPAHLRCPNRSTNESFQLDMFADDEFDKLVWDSYHKKWDWVMDEMIWAFEQINTDWERQYWKVMPELDIETKVEPDEDGCVPVLWKTKGDIDWDGRMQHQERINNGFRLFGKYYNGLWW